MKIGSEHIIVMRLKQGDKKAYKQNNIQDIVIVCFADILLMGGELGSLSVTLDNIKLERRCELAFED